jgi:hypothetical protein
VEGAAVRRYLASKYSTRQSFTREYLKLELLISAKEARELQFEVLGTVKDMVSLSVLRLQLRG